MNHSAITTAIQSIAIVAVCAAMGLSLAKVSGGESSSFPLVALGGAAMGLVGVIVGLIIRAPVGEFERRRKPRQLIGLRIATVGLIVAVTGWLVAVFLSDTLGYSLVVIGTLGGGVGILFHRFQAGRAT